MFNSGSLLLRFSLCVYDVHASGLRFAWLFTDHHAIWKPYAFFNVRYGGLVVRITVLCLCFYTPLNVKISTSNCMKMHHLKWRITKIFWGGGIKCIPTPRTPPPSAPRRSCLPWAIPRISSDPRNAPERQGTGQNFVTCCFWSLCICVLKQRHLFQSLDRRTACHSEINYKYNNTSSRIAYSVEPEEQKRHS